jgi:2-C-methyl-D-erythritol 4-phosphate cytidylyltransferase
MARKAVILVAGGTGTRMNSAVAKQFIPIGGKPVLMHTFDAFYRYDAGMQFILVLFRSLESEWRNLSVKYNFNIPHTIVAGGEERFHSVKNGLSALQPDIELVAVHDAVRPLVTSETIARSFDAAAKYGAAIPVIPVTDTIRRLNEGSSFTLPRNELAAVQTPQCFNRDLLVRSYELPYSTIFTDDASVVEYGGNAVHLVEGNRTNIKITTLEDLLIAEAFLKNL